MHQCFKTSVELPNEVDQIMIAVIGFTGAVVGYVVGSSKSSADKDATINKAMGATPPPNTTETTNLPEIAEDLWSRAEEGNDNYNYFAVVSAVQEARKEE